MIYTEITPNPASLKFVTGQILIKNGTADFPDASQTEDAPIVARIFNFRFVESVFIGRNFITITKGADFQWEEVIPAMKDFLKSYFNSGQPILTGKYLIESEEVTEEGEIEQKIRKLIDESVRPAVAMDGGDIIYQGFENGVVKLKLMGSCSGCPSAVITLKAGIEGMLTRMIPEVTSVEAV